MKKDNEVKRNIEKLEEELESRKKLPEVEKQKLFKKCRTNVIILITILIYLILLRIGEANIQTETYIMILKVLNIVLIIGTIIILEISYRCNKNEIIVHSVEILIASFFTLFLIPAYSLYYGNFYKVIIVGVIFSIVYYLLKCTIIIIKFKRTYHKSLTDIKTIVAK